MWQGFVIESKKYMNRFPHPRGGEPVMLNHIILMDIICGISELQA